MPDNDHHLIVKLKRNGIFKLGKRQMDVLDEATSEVSIELCYHKDTAIEVKKIAALGSSREAAEFVIAVNHIFLIKAKMSSKLGSLISAPITDETNLESTMIEVIDSYVKPNSRFQVNLGYVERTQIVKNQYAYSIGQQVVALLSARDYLTKYLKEAINDKVGRGSVGVSKRFAQIWKAQQSPTDIKVLSLIGAKQGPRLKIPTSRGRRYAKV